jgi:hypothetical protein
VPEFQAQIYMTSFQAAIEASGGKDVQITLMRYGDQYASYHGKWAD